jgi:hypothetical protein
VEVLDAEGCWRSQLDCWLDEGRVDGVEEEWESAEGYLIVSICEDRQEIESETSEEEDAGGGEVGHGWGQENTEAKEAGASRRAEEMAKEAGASRRAEEMAAHERRPQWREINRRAQEDAEDLCYHLDREREYRERNVQRKRGGGSCTCCAPVRAMRAGRGQRKAHPRLQQSRMKMIVGPGYARGGWRVGATAKGAAVELRERLTDLFC